MKRLLGVLALLLLLVTIPYSWIVTGGRENRPIDAFAELLADKLHKKPKVPEAINQVLAAQPLSADAYYAAALGQRRNGKAAAEEALIAQALRSDPRLTQARLTMAERSLRAGRIEDAIAQFAVLSRFQNLSGPVSLILGRAAGEPRVRNAIRENFAGTPAVIDITAAAAAEGIATPQLLELLKGTDLNGLPGGYAGVQGRLTSVLYDKKAYPQAYQVWRALLRSPSTHPVYDGSFAGPIAAPPFGWTLNVSPDVEAIPLDLRVPPYRSALQVRAFASTASTAAEEVILLPAGSSELRFIAETTDPAKGAPQSSWRLTCNSGTLISEFPFTALATWKSYGWNFVVPPGCPLQKLELRVSAPASTAAGPLLVTGVAAKT